MPRKYRLVVVGQPHHVIQRGNRRQKVFYSDGDRLYYLRLLHEQSQKHGVIIWGYCLMDNHVHLVLVPLQQEALAKVVAETHRSYTLMINRREGWRGYLWQCRYSSFVMDDLYLLKTMRYVERNPVRAGMVQSPEDYPWSSARDHVGERRDVILADCPLLNEISSWREFLRTEDADHFLDVIRQHNQTGRPFGEDNFLKMVSDVSGISVEDIRGRSPGRPKKK